MFWGRLGRALLGLSLASVICASAGAQVVNGGFETGAFPPWLTTGNDSVTGTYSGQAPEEGSFQAAITTTSGGTVLLPSGYVCRYGLERRGR